MYKRIEAGRQIGRQVGIDIDSEVENIADIEEKKDRERWKTFEGIGYFFVSFVHILF